MKKQLIVSLIVLLLGTWLGTQKEVLTPIVEKIYCSIVPVECTGVK